MTTTLPRPGASHSHRFHAIFAKPGWLPPSDDPDLSAARERHEQLVAGLAAAVERERALPREHDALKRRRDDALRRQATGEDAALPALPSADKLASELADAQAKVDAARAVVAEHAQSVLALIDERRDELRAVFSIAADEARVQAERLEAQARELRAEQARRLLPVRWLDSTRPAEPHPPRFADLVARDPEILEGWRREASGELTDRDHLLRAMSPGSYSDAPDEEED